MKNFLYGVLGFILAPLIIIGSVIYFTSWIVQLVCRTINVFLGKCMRWIDENITQNMQ